jgi:hypothetical protein
VALQLLDQERLLSKMLLAFRYVPFGLGEVLQKDVPVHDPSIAQRAIGLHRAKSLVAEGGG